jgi:restriction system protein
MWITGCDPQVHWGKGGVNLLDAMENGLRAERFLREIVVFDGADGSQQDIFDAVRSVLNYKRVRSVIVTGRREIGFRGERVLNITALNQDDARFLIEDILSRSSLDQDSLAKVLSVVKGNPAAISVVTDMGLKLDHRQLAAVLGGHLYDISESPASSRSDLITVAKPTIISASEAIVQALKKQPKEIFKLKPRQLEELTAELLRDMGHEVKLTKETRDGGADILAYINTGWGFMLCLVDAKLYRDDRKIGVEMVRTLYGMLNDY